MVDIHTHILPSMDDGAKDVATSVAMLGAEMEQGVRTVVCTPHYYGVKLSPKQFLAKREGALKALEGQIPQGLTLKMGAEVHFTGVNTIDYEELCSLAIEGTEYILFELPFKTVWDGNLLSAIEDFIKETDYTPIIAHIGRYKRVQEKPSIIGDLVKMGCLIQLNAEAFLDKESKGLAFALLKKGLAHCIGSDGHNTDTRSVDMLTAKKEIEKRGLLVEWEIAQANMQAIVRGEQVSVERGKTVKKFLGKYF